VLVGRRRGGRGRRQSSNRRQPGGVYARTVVGVGVREREREKLVFGIAKGAVLRTVDPLVVARIRVGGTPRSSRTWSSGFGQGLQRRLRGCGGGLWRYYRRLGRRLGGCRRGRIGPRCGLS
jgi:hypothetical protein